MANQVQKLMGMALLCAAGLAFAGNGTAEEPGVEVSLERTLSATPDEMRTNTPTWVAEIREAAATLVRLDQATRRARDGEGLDCVTTNLDAARLLVETSASAQAALEAALQRADEYRASFEYRKISIALKRSRELTDEADRCAAGEGLRDGTTRRELTGEPGRPTDETGPAKEDPTEWAFDPPNASPF